MQNNYLLVLLISLFSSSLLAQWAGRGSDLPYTNTIILGIDAIDENTAWGVPYNTITFAPSPSVTRTTDGGATWIVMEDIEPNEANYSPLSIFAFSAEEAWVSMYNINANAFGYIYHTDDGGATWDKQNSAFGDQAPLGVHFWDENNGFAFGNNGPGAAPREIKAYTTSNGGDDWEQVTLPNLSNLDPLTITSANGIFEVFDETIWIGTGAGNILKSEDMGETWELIDVGLNNRAINNIAFKDELNGVCVSVLTTNITFTSNLVLYTSDGGQTWTEGKVKSGPQITSIAYVPGTKNTYFGSASYFGDKTSFYSIDGGKHWKEVRTPALASVDFVSEDVAWAGGNIDQGGMYKLTSSFANDHVNVSTYAGFGKERLIDTEDKAHNTGFWNPKSMAMDADGNLYVADAYNGAIRKIDTDGNLTTIFDELNVFNRPEGLAFDSNGDLYFSDLGQNDIIKIALADGSLTATTYAGTGEEGDEDGPALSATFTTISEMVFDADDNLYVADNNSIRKISSTGEVSTLAGSTETGFMDGTGSEALFNFIWGMTMGPDNHLYVTDIANCAVRRVSLTGDVTTIAGNGFPGYNNGDGSGAQFYYPEGIAADAAGNLYVGDGKNGLIRKVDTDGNVSDVAGIYENVFSFLTVGEKVVNGDGAAARFGRSRSLMMKPDGHLLVSGWDNDVIRELELGGASHALVVREVDILKPFETDIRKHAAPLIFSTNIENISEYDQADIEFSVDVKLNNLSVYTQTSEAQTIAANSNADFSFSEVFFPMDTGTYKITMRVKTPNEGTIYELYDEHFVSDTSVIAHDSYFYYAADAEQFLGQGTGSTGLQYDFAYADTLEGFYVLCNVDSMTEVLFEILTVNDDELEVLHFETRVFDEDFNGWYYVELEEPLALTPGSYVFGAGDLTEEGSFVQAYDNNANTQKAWLRSADNGVPDWTLMHPLFGLPNGVCAPMFHPKLVNSTISNLIDIPLDALHTNVYPNPFQRQLTLSFDEIADYSCRVTDAKGTLITTFEVQQQSLKSIELPNLPTGTYFLHISDGKQEITKRVVKQ